MKNIATLTVNPTIDVAYDVPHMSRTHKIRTVSEHYSPGGGGINIARVFVRLGGNARCYYLAGGATGKALDGLVDQHQLVRHNITIGGDTRIAVVVHEQETGDEYRLVPPGPYVTEDEWRACLDALSHVSCDILVASGSLPPGMPVDFYARTATIMRERGIDFVLDTSGEALGATLAAGGVRLVKPSLSELSHLCDRRIESIEDASEAAMDIVQRGQAELVAVTMGDRGALLAQRGGVLHRPAIKVEARSAVGAGDSFLAAMVHALARGWDPVDAFRYGIAAGAAAVLARSTNLAHTNDIEDLFALSARK